MANGFLTALQGIGYFLAELRMVMPEHDSTEWLTSLLSRWRMMPKWNSSFNLYNDMKSLFIAITTIAAAFTQACLLGLNGLTLISIPMTIYLGLMVIERTTEKEERV